MDNNNIIISIISHGCELARKLQCDLTSMMNQPNLIFDSCSEIITAFMAAQEKLSDHHHYHTSLYSDQHNLLISGEMSIKNGLCVEERLLRSSSYSHGMEYQRTMDSSQGYEHVELTPNVILSEQNQVAACVGGSDGVGGFGKFQTGQSSGSSKAPDSSSIKKRRSSRKERDGRRRFKVAAPTIGNTEIPPDDGFTWRKYGQKEILGSRFPRAYFRCTHQKLYHCPAKKQVQRIDEDPNTFEVTYRNDHTCHMSATAPAPSIILPPSIRNELTTKETISGNTRARTTTTTTTSAETWLSMGTVVSPTPTVLNPNQFTHPVSHSFGYQPMTDMVYTMFNSEPGGYNTSLDQIFTSIEECDQVGEEDRHLIFDTSLGHMDTVGEL